MRQSIVLAIFIISSLGHAKPLVEGSLSKLNRPVSKAQLAKMDWSNSKKKRKLLCASDTVQFGSIYDQIVEPLKSRIMLQKVKDEHHASLHQFLKKYSRIRSVNIDLIRVLVNPESRAKDDVRQFSEAILEARFDVRGSSEKKLRQDILFMKVAIKRNEKAGWRIVSMEKVEEQTTIQGNEKPGFENVTESIGLNQVPVQLRTEAIRRGGYALAVNDFNNDQHSDIFVGLRDGGQMYRLKGKRYEPVETAMNKEIFIKTALFADFDNDGGQESVIVRFTPKDSSWGMSPKIDVVLYKNDGKGNYSLSANKFGATDRQREPMPATVGDFNGDGYLDFYVGYPGHRDFTSLAEPESSKKMKVQGLYINNKKGGFVDQSESHLNYANVASFRSALFPHSSVALDYDLDGDIDIVVADDRGNISPFYQNTGKGKFIEASKKIGVANFGFAMTIAAGDYNNDGITDFAITNVTTSAQKTASKSCMANWSTGFGLESKGLRLFQGSKNGVFTETTESAGLEFPGNGTGGLTFVDYDDDGYQDIYVVNGLWSGTSTGQDLSYLFASSVGLRDDSFYSLREADSEGFLPMLSTKHGFWNWQSMSWTKEDLSRRPSLAGFEHNRLYRNNGDGTFTDVAFFEGVDLLADGYVSGKIDYNRDGHVDLLLRNADPGTKQYQYAPVTLFKNSGNKNQSVTLKLKTKGADAIGSFVVSEVRGVGQSVHHLIGNNGAMQSERIIHIGMGTQKNVKKLTIHWRNGSEQVIENLPAGFHEFEQPAALEKVGSL